MSERLKKPRYAAIGEFHVCGADLDAPVARHLHGALVCVANAFKESSQFLNLNALSHLPISEFLF